ncbi:MAG: glycosyltransferase family 9 protein [Nitrospirae bacterium]|nr:glycosyltransferase family 9 protein [Nitrospirota bacterium]
MQQNIHNLINMVNIFKKIFYRLIFYAGPFFSNLTENEFEQKDIRKILVVSIGEIGDILRLFPLFNAVKTNFPSSKISILTTLPCDHDVWTLLPRPINIDDKIVLDIKKNHRGILGKLRLIRDLRKKAFDLTIDPSRGDGMGPNSIMSFLIGSPHRVGFQKGGIGFLHTVRVNFSDEEYIGRQNLRLLEAMGISVSYFGIELHLPDPDHFIVNLFASLKDPVVVIHPGAKWNGWYRCWPPHKYAELAKTIIRDYDASLLLLGDDSEKKLTSWIAMEAGHPNVIDLAGKTSLSEVALIIKHSRLFIGNDSSLLHLAVALNTPAIGIFGPTFPGQVLPDNPNFVAVCSDLSCRPCYTHQPLFNNQCTNRECLERLSVNNVMDAVRPMFDNMACRMPGPLTGKRLTV